MTTPDGIFEPESERVIARLRPHARRMFWPALVLIAVCAAVGYFGGQLPERWENTLLYVGAALAVAVFCLLPLVVWMGKRYIITTRRLIVRHGFFVRVRHELMHSRSFDISVRKNWVQSMFGSGDIRINAGLEHPLVLRDVPRANNVQSALHELGEKHPVRVAPWPDTSALVDDARVDHTEF